MGEVNDSETPTSLESEVKEEVALPVVSIEDWETYTNSALGFEIKYPQQVMVTNELNTEFNKSTSFEGAGLSFEVMLREKWDGFDLKNYFYMDFPVSKEITLLGQTANIYEMPNGYCDGPGCSDPSITIVLEHNSDVFHIGFRGDALMSDVEQEILNTFIFIDKENQDSLMGASLKEIEYSLPEARESKIFENHLQLSPKVGGGYLSLEVFDYSINEDMRSTYCKLTNFCIDGATQFVPMSIGNVSGYSASRLDNSGGGNEYFATKGDKFYIISTYSPPNQNNFDENKQNAIDSLKF